MKATAVAPSNIAFIKYWGLADPIHRIPTNGSISMNLSNLTTTTTVEFSLSYKTDDITIDGKKDKGKIERVIAHLDRIRRLKKTKLCAKVVSKNNFPAGTGLSSSASGFAALTVAAANALGLILSEKELSIIARQGSGSACRSIPSGFVEWHKGTSDQTSYAETIYPADSWDIVDIVACVSTAEKTVPTTEGQMYAITSPFFKERLKNIDNKISLLRQSIAHRDFKQFGSIIEKEALELHAIMMTSTPSLVYMLSETLQVITEIVRLRKNGIPVYFTLNTGQNIHVMCKHQSVKKVEFALKKIPYVKKLITNNPSRGAHIVEKHLF